MSNLFRCLGRFCRIALLCTLALGLCVISAHAQVFTQPKNISSAVSNSAYPAMVVDAVGNINISCG